MRYLAAVVLFAIALVALAASFGGSTGKSRQIQFTTQPVKVVNTPSDGGYIPVANQSDRPLYVVGQPAPPVLYEYKVSTYTPPTENSSAGVPQRIDQAKLPNSYEAFLNEHPDWEPVAVPTTFRIGPNIVVFRRRK